MTPRWVRLVLLGAVMGGCATNLLVGADGDDGTTVGPDTPPATGSSGTGTGTVAGVDAGVTSAGPATGDSAVESTGDVTGSTGGGMTSLGTDTGGECPATDFRSCGVLEGCVWDPEAMQCSPAGLCDGVSVGDCLGLDACVWQGSIGAGACTSGPCSALRNERLCATGLGCVWDGANCFSLPCDDLDPPICAVHPDCGVAGPELEPVCVPGECLVTDCGDLAVEACVVSGVCHMLGEAGNGTCLPVECVGCFELSMAECAKAFPCGWDFEFGLCAL